MRNNFFETPIKLDCHFMIKKYASQKLSDLLKKSVVNPIQIKTEQGYTCYISIYYSLNLDYMQMRNFGAFQVANQVTMLSNQDF